MIKPLSQNKVEISCSANCCPTVEYSDGQIKITDDFGGEIKVTTEQAEFLTEAAKQCQT
jgi:hypothetical protein